jgi:hypothetical protein
MQVVQFVGLSLRNLVQSQASTPTPAFRGKPRRKVQKQMKGTDMTRTIEAMLSNFELGKLTRRQLALSLTALVTAAQAAPKATGLRAVSINHVTIKVPNLQRTSQF